MIPIDFQVSRSKVKVKGHASLLHLVQLITPERFAPETSILVGTVQPSWKLISQRPVVGIVGRGDTIYGDNSHCFTLGKQP